MKTDERTDRRSHMMKLVDFRNFCERVSRRIVAEQAIWSAMYSIKVPEVRQCIDPTSPTNNPNYSN